MKTIFAYPQPIPRLTTQRIALLLCLITLVCGACAPPDRTASNGYSSAATASAVSDLSGRILLWHAWQDTESAALDGILERYGDLHPHVQVQVRVFAGEDEMLADFETAALSGLGPDLLLASSARMPDLVDAGLIDDIRTEFTEADQERYAAAAVATLNYRDGLYGIPESQNTMVLYFNRRLSEQPPATLDALLKQAEDGAIVLLGSAFDDAFWGVAAFGGRLFDEDGRVILDEGGFANWLAWLKDARDLPGVILDGNRQVLQQRFIEGEATYYAGSSREFVELRQALGEDAVGVAPLPEGPLGPGGPFLRTRALFFSAVSSPNQRRLAHDLARFMTNAEQNATLLREASHVPANQDVRINPRLNPVVDAIAEQVRTAVPMPAGSEMQTVLALASDIYAQVLEGEIEPAEAAIVTSRAINEAIGAAPMATDAERCQDVGIVHMLNAWPAPRRSHLAESVTRYRQACPGVIVQMTQLAPDEALERAQTDPGAFEEYHLIAGSQILLAALVDAEVVLRLDGAIQAQALQRFRPSALQSMRVGEGLYGLPVLADVKALYYNNELVQEPARTLGELRAESQTGVPVVLQTGFVDAFWGIGAMGGEILVDQTYQPAAFTAGFTEWLTWLRETEAQSAALLTTESAAATEAFLTGESAYLIADLSRLPMLQEALGDRLSTAPLPAGPGGTARPVVLVDGLFFDSTISDADFAVARNLAAYITDTAALDWVGGEGAALPAVSTGDDLLAVDPLYAAFVEEARAAAHLPATAALPDLIAVGDAAYSAVLLSDAEPSDAVRRTIEAFQEITTAAGIEAAPVLPEAAGSEQTVP